MRASILSVLSLSLTGCVAFTTSGTEETVLFSPTLETPVENAQAVLKPHNDLPLAIEFACPNRLGTLMTSYVIPLPPVLPAGYVFEPVSYLRVRMPEGAEDILARTRILTQAGNAIPLSAARQFRRSAGSDGSVETTYALDKECAAFNGGVLEVAGFSYNNKSYPASQARLQFDSKITADVGWWPPSLFNGGQPLHGVIDTPSTSGH
ncbi:MAG TPA: hypothetical protein VEC01_06415 [Noviherbaspirillum sp.]|uniref:hypothetical protein n=1 Tax=Noviherbaspirillum sp. TaxID=1926288 RepID=UPI002D7124C1|nr:hypothetical protein [Noviherbaspirillum sp.]HYD94940.1 hypothetical protein [Noviherbaspirillum sp.]